MKECKVCGIDGADKGEIKCKTCKGDGLKPRSGVIFKGKQKNEPCATCSGAGSLRCGNCDGSGNKTLNKSAS